MKRNSSVNNYYYCYVLCNYTTYIQWYIILGYMICSIYINIVYTILK